MKVTKNDCLRQFRRCFVEVRDCEVVEIVVRGELSCAEGRLLCAVNPKRELLCV